MALQTATRSTSGRHAGRADGSSRRAVMAAKIDSLAHRAAGRTARGGTAARNVSLAGVRDRPCWRARSEGRAEAKTGAAPSSRTVEDPQPGPTATAADTAHPTAAIA